MNVARLVALAAVTSSSCVQGRDSPGSSGGQIAGPAPDYVVAAVGDPPAVALNGATFSTAVTVENIGTAAAEVASSTRYFLSQDRVVGGDVKFARSSVVPALDIGASDTQTVSLVVPTVPSASYYLIACADRGAVIAELDNRNNCTASAGTVSVTGPDLVVEAIGEPPEVILPPATFAASDTTRNIGTAPAGASNVAYFLSSTPALAPDARRLKQTRPVGPLAAGAASSGATTVVVPAIPPLPPGPYYLVACADRDPKRVAESNELNNCLTSNGTLTIPAPDLVITSLAEPPGALLAGESFAVTDATANVGNLAVRGTATRYFLSTDAMPGGDLPVVGSRLVPPLAAGETSGVPTSISIASTTPAAEYFLVACADATGVVAEFSESNNCRVSTGSITVSSPVPQPADVTVRLLGRELRTVPGPGVPVLAYASDGSLAARVDTDMNGVAQITVPAGGSLTVVEIEARYLTTFASVQSGELLVGDFGPFEFAGSGLVNLPPHPLPEKEYVVQGPCAISGFASTEVVEVNVSTGCGAERRPLMATVHDSIQIRGYLYDPEVDLVPGQSASMEGEWQPPVEFTVSMTGILDDLGGAGLTVGRFLGPRLVYQWFGPGPADTFTLSDGHLVASLLQANGGDGRVTHLTVGGRHVLEYLVTDSIQLEGDVLADLVTMPVSLSPIQGEMEPGGPIDVTGMRWEMTDGITVDGMLVRFEKVDDEFMAFAWTVIAPPAPIGPNEITLPRLPSDLVPVWVGGTMNDWRVLAVDTPAGSLAEFSRDADPRRAWQWQWIEPMPGKVRMSGL